MAGPDEPKTGGRQKGTPNKITKALKEMILGALDDAGGQDYLARMAEQQPAAFMTLLGKVLPTTVAGDSDSPVRTIITRMEIQGSRMSLAGDDPKHVVVVPGGLFAPT